MDKGLRDELAEIDRMAGEDESYARRLAPGDRMATVEWFVKRRRLRAEFAGRAMQGLLSSRGSSVSVTPALAVRYADALLDALDKDNDCDDGNPCTVDDACGETDDLNGPPETVAGALCRLVEASPVFLGGWVECDWNECIVCGATSNSASEPVDHRAGCAYVDACRMLGITPKNKHSNEETKS